MEFDQQDTDDENQASTSREEVVKETTKDAATQTTSDGVEELSGEERDKLVIKCLAQLNHKHNYMVVRDRSDLTPNVPMRVTDVEKRLRAYEGDAAVNVVVDGSEVMVQDWSCGEDFLIAINVTHKATDFYDSLAVLAKDESGSLFITMVGAAERPYSHPTRWVFSFIKAEKRGFCKKLSEVIPHYCC